MEITDASPRGRVAGLTTGAVDRREDAGVVRAVVVRAVVAVIAVGVG